MPSSGPSDYGAWIRTDLAEERRGRARGEPPFELGKYAVERRLGEGGAGIVYRARDRELGRDVAVKILREAIGANPVVRERFLREARVSAAIPHPNIVAVHDMGEVDGQPYLVM